MTLLRESAKASKVDDVVAIVPKDANAIDSTTKYPLHGVKVHRRKCIHCGQTWGEHLWDSAEPRVGKESFVCRCGIKHSTGWVEWAHMLPKRRFDYFFSSAEIGTMVICVFSPGLFGYFVGAHGWRSVMTASAWGFLVGAVLVGMMWTSKMVIVRLSLRRSPHDDPTKLRGLWPWRW